MAKKKSKGKTIIRVISIIIWILAIVALGMLTYEIYSFNILPSKYYLIIGAVALFLVLLFILFVVNKKTKKLLLILLDILFIIMITVCFFAYDKLSSVVDFMNTNLGAKYDTNVYYVIVNSKSEYKNIESIKGKTVKLVDDINDKETLERSFNKKLDVKYEYVDNISELLYEIKENPELILIVNSGNYDAMIENDGMIETDIKFESSIKKIETLEIVFKVENKDTGVDVTIDPFVVYLSGIDTRSNKLPAKSGSDVNIILVINPQKHEILMINTPRDYFVQLNGTTGLIPSARIAIDGTSITVNSSGQLQASGGGGSYTAGDGIDITNDVISVTNTISSGASAGSTALQPADVVEYTAAEVQTIWESI